jgi:hypothetical protein
MISPHPNLDGIAERCETNHFKLRSARETHLQKPAMIVGRQRDSCHATLSSDRKVGEVQTGHPSVGADLLNDNHFGQPGADRHSHTAYATKQRPTMRELLDRSVLAETHFVQPLTNAVFGFNPENTDILSAARGVERCRSFGTSRASGWPL